MRIDVVLQNNAQDKRINRRWSLKLFIPRKTGQPGLSQIRQKQSRLYIKINLFFIIFFIIQINLK